MQRPFIHPYAYSIIILLFTIVTTAIFILLLLLSFCYCYYYKTVTINNGVWDLQLVKCRSCEPYLFFTTIDLSCTILKFIFSLASKIETYIPYLLLVATCSKGKKIKEKKERKKFQSTSTCMFHVYSSFICFYTLLLIVAHHWVELEVPLDISFAYWCSLNIESLIICFTTCYFHRSNKLKSSNLILSPSYSRMSMG
jgi:hypothetical protein